MSRFPPADATTYYYRNYRIREIQGTQCCMVFLDLQEMMRKHNKQGREMHYDKWLHQHSKDLEQLENRLGFRPLENYDLDGKWALAFHKSLAFMYVKSINEAFGTAMQIEYDRTKVTSPPSALPPKKPSLLTVHDKPDLHAKVREAKRIMLSKQKEAEEATLAYIAATEEALETRQS